MHTKKALAVFLSRLRTFHDPNPRLEQYPTDSEIAATILWDAYMRGDIEGKRIVDLGCGTGILGIGALALGASHVQFYELDPRVFPILMENIARLEEKQEIGGYEIIECNIDTCPDNCCEADTVLQNPPFGTRVKGIDTSFLKKAISIGTTIYSLHKSSTLEYLRTVVQKEGKRITNTADFKFPLKNTMKQHKKKLQRIDVTCLRIE